MSEIGEKIKIVHNKNHKQVKGTFRTLELEDDGFKVVMLPSLKLSAYGNTFKEAYAMLQDIVLPDFCEHLMNQPLNKVVRDLKALGWIQDRYFLKELSKSHIDTEGILRDLDLSETTVIKESTITV